MRLPRKWVLSLGLLAAAPGMTVAGPLDFLKPRAGGETAAASKSNGEIAQDVASALRDARLVSKGVEIEVLGGVCTLKGEIADAQQRAAATRIVSSVPGVESVDNQLKLMSSAGAPQALRTPSGVQQAGFEGNSGRRVQRVSNEVAAPQSNQEQAQQIANAIAAIGLSGYDIEVRCRDGVAGLKGEVGSAQEAAMAVKAAKGIPGVVQVLNGLTVNGQPAAAPAPQRPAGYPAMPAGYPQMQSAGYPQMQPAGMPQPAAMPAMPVGGHMLHNRPNMPEYAWPAYAPYDNYAQVTYPGQYDASAWPYIGPFYPYPQVPAEWRSAQLVWDDGYWQLKFHSRTDKWWWFMDPHNWH